MCLWHLLALVSLSLTLQYFLLSLFLELTTWNNVLSLLEQVGMETEGFAIYDTMMNVKNEVLMSLVSC